MDSIEKFLRKLTSAERGRAQEILERLSKGDTKGMDVKKLKGREDVFRIRKGDIRIIYRTERTAVFILAIERRSSHTY